MHAGAFAELILQVYRSSCASSHPGGRALAVGTMGDAWPPWRALAHGGTSIKDSIDGYVMPVQPVELFRQGTLNALDVMIGGNSYDGLATYYIK